MRHTRQSGLVNRWRDARHGAMSVSLVVVLAACQPTTKFSDPNLFSTSLAGGVALLRAGRFADAYAMFNATSPFETRNPDTLSGLAIAADMTAKKSVARRAYEALAITESGKASFYNNRGYSRMLNGELQAALSDLTRAATLAPNNVKIRNNLEMLRAVLPRRGE